jgi:sterol desaturase/sphingolipid hydroxylase (fatty acid hydroxylase superfamily)
MRVINDMNTWITVSTLVLLYYYSDPLETYDWWISFVDWLPGNDDRMKFVVFSHLVLESAFWVLVCSITVLEGLGWIERIRIQSIPEDPERLRSEQALTNEAFKDVLVSHWIIRPLLLYFLWPYFELQTGPLRTPIPSIRSILPQIFFCMMIDDTWFYWMHRLFHVIPFLYRSIHKKHHRFTRPNVFSTEYAHPVEDAIVNSFGTILGPLVLGVHPFLLVIYVGMKLYQSMEAHSGFNIPFPFSITHLIDSMDCAPAHDFHHSHNMSNFGGWFMFWDWICGTDKSYEKHVMIKHKDDQVYNGARRPYEHDK